ncbi:FAD-binding oxidoreductase [[Pseudomonas] carboxydohydrogena]|uniref:FAD-binding oxidoreductase n=1 Tax=Afipia carboxydohydrogena TaxID=290 RepID=A0ABY8BRM0_AFICR|nr:FAD-binding oxidoreductase [[Pseudomonas] carboxydohydrogena]WEF52608.1 FAD-binding oxidoreductase [[Pseudomonas] carboxydohydrogena]
MTIPSSETPVHVLWGDLPAAEPRAALSLDLDTDVCVVGGGFAGLTAAREAARRGMSVVVLEGHQIGWAASGHNLGSVLPGYGVPIEDLIARVGIGHARDLWKLAEEGGGYIRDTIATSVPDIAMTPGALEVSTTDVGERLIGWLQTIGGEFGTEVEGWQIERVRTELRTRRYFHALHFPKAFQIDGARYLRALAALAEDAGVRIFENTPVVSIDSAGIRKRIVTPSARLRAGHVVLAGNIHIGTPALRLASTLMPLWRYAAVTEPLGDLLNEAIAYRGSVLDDDGIDHFRVVDGDRLLWSSPETTWRGKPERFGRLIRRRIATVFPQLAQARIERVFSSAFGQTVHGMPQIGEMRPGLWVASGFGRQGLNTSAMAGRLVAAGMAEGDDRWRLFSPFELVWAGGNAGRVVGQFADGLSRGRSAAAGLLARWRERAVARERLREERRSARIAAVLARTERVSQDFGSDRH